MAASQAQQTMRRADELVWFGAALFAAQAATVAPFFHPALPAGIILSVAAFGFWAAAAAATWMATRYAYGNAIPLCGRWAGQQPWSSGCSCRRWGSSPSTPTSNPSLASPPPGLLSSVASDQGDPRCAPAT